MNRVTTAVSIPIALALILQNVSSQPIQAAVGFAIIGYHITSYLIPRVGPAFIKRGLFGKDLSKVGKPVIPETMGVIPGITYLFIMFFFIPFMFIKYLVKDENNSGFGFKFPDDEITGSDIVGGDLNNGIGESYHFPHNKLSSFLSCLLSLESVILLGLMDDLFDIRWRHKFFLPAIASIPLLIVYYVDFGVTSILIPNILKTLFNINSDQISIDLKGFYYIYMGSVAIFCPNSVNILAGVNGLEVGQTIVIAVLLLMNDVFYLVLGSSGSPAYSIHLFSSCMLIPFLGVSLALLKYNWFPARVFVGDTFCYFSGMVFAVVGISGHFAKTLMLFFIPQIINFIYSAPQLFGIVHCPRHRMPKFNEEDGLLYNSYTDYTDEKVKPLSSLVANVLLILEKLYLIKLQKDPKSGKILKSSNLTLINLALVWTGPLREDKLCLVLLTGQFLLGFLMLILRHTVAPLLFGFDNSWSMLNRFY